MPFIGQSPITGGFHKLDAITTSSTNTYDLLLNGSAYSPESANHLMVSLNGVIQSPGSSFTISGSQITFVPSSGTLSSSDSIDFIMAYGNVLDIGTPSDGTVTTNKIVNSAVTDAKIAPNAVTVDKLANTLDLSSKTVTLPTGTGGKVLKAEISQITASSSRASATSYDDDLVFNSFTPSTSNSTVFIWGVANFDGANSNYVYYKWFVDGSEFMSTGSTPVATHIFYSSTSLNNLGLLPSPIITSVNNTDGSAIAVKCQGKVQSGTLWINRANNASSGGSPSSVMYIEVAN